MVFAQNLKIFDFYHLSYLPTYGQFGTIFFQNMKFSYNVGNDRRYFWLKITFCYIVGHDTWFLNPPPPILLVMILGF